MIALLIALLTAIALCLSHRIEKLEDKVRILETKE